LPVLVFLWVSTPSAALGAADTFFQRLWQRETLSSDWRGVRTRLVDAGIHPELIHTNEIVANLTGGHRRKAVYLNNIDLTLTFDMGQLVDWEGASIFVYGLGNYGGNPSNHVGDAQVVSNIETIDTWKLYEAWIQKNLWYNRLSVLIGLYDLNSEFDHVETAQVFLNSSFGIGADFAQSGKNGPSVFPTTSVGVRLTIKPTDALYLRTAVFDGVPGDPSNPHGTQVTFDSHDGFLVATELGYVSARAIDLPVPSTLSVPARPRHIGRGEHRTPTAHVAFGSWFYTAKFDHVVKRDGSGNPLQRRGNFGLYGLAEWAPYYEAGNMRHDVAFFLRLGSANTKTNQFGFYSGGGFVVTGLIPGRGDDRLGFAVAVAYNGDRFRKARRRIRMPVDRAEVVLEWTYRTQLAPWLVVQPDLQYVINPGTDPTLDNALVLGLRFKVAF
jgi:porin